MRNRRLARAHNGPEYQSRGTIPWSLAAAVSATLSSAVTAQQPPLAGSGAQLEEIIVTAQKRQENMQNVPISIQALEEKTLQELQVASFDDYAKYLPSLSFQSFGPGQAQLYVRGVTNGGDGLHVGSEPLVGVYLDEQPVTTIANNLDVHIYDIARVEALSGPQGTLYGASSMAGTLRIITNKPNTAGFEAGYDVMANKVTAGGPGGEIEGFVNVPVSDRVAIRLVAFGERDGGFINNVLGPPETYPTSGIPRSNAGLQKQHYNDVETSGGRAALKFDLNDRWTITPSAMAQRQAAYGQFAFTPELGDLNIARYSPERNDDRWWQAALTVQGKISDFDVTYAGGYLHRTIDSNVDYSDYSYFYDLSYLNTPTPTYFGDNFRDNNGHLISPAQTTISHDLFTKQSHELRISTPKDWKLHGVVGMFFQKQVDHARNEYRVADLATLYSVTGEPGVLYLNSQERVDKDTAAFTDLAYDLTSHWTVTGGIRVFKYDNTVNGFFGYSGNPTFDGYIHASGEISCVTAPDPTNPVQPCVNINSVAGGRGETHRVNLTYKFDDERLLYGTWSTGFRPGGVNRVRTRPPYTPDYLSNFEIGWKTTWFDHHLRFNGAFFYERWKDAQYAITGLNGITEVINAGTAEIRGVEADVHWVPSEGLTLSASTTLLNTKLTNNACNFPSPTFTCTEPSPDGAANSILAPSGTRLPVSPRFKGNLIARYQFPLGNYGAHAQAAVVTQSDVIPALTVADAQMIGNQPAYTSVDLSTGIHHGSWSTELYVENAFDRRGQAYRYTNCAPATCTDVNVIPIHPRTVGITFGQKF